MVSQSILAFVIVVFVATFFFVVIAMKFRKPPTMIDPTNGHAGGLPHERYWTCKVWGCRKYKGKQC